jgi:hypothetical protein
MNPIDPSEITALLDGELSREREEQVRLAIAEDPDLQREYCLLAGLHNEWLATAGNAGFCPDVSIPADRNTMPPSVFLLVGILLILRIITKTLSPGVAWSLEITALALILTWLLQIIIPACSLHSGMLPEKNTFHL